MDRETRIAMVADYLLGKTLKYISNKYNISHGGIMYWINRHKDHFKLRDKFTGRPGGGRKHG